MSLRRGRDLFKNPNSKLVWQFRLKIDLTLAVFRTWKTRVCRYIAICDCSLRTWRSLIYLKNSLPFIKQESLLLYSQNSFPGSSSDLSKSSFMATPYSFKDNFNLSSHARRGVLVSSGFPTKFCNCFTSPGPTILSSLFSFPLSCLGESHKLWSQLFLSSCFLLLLQSRYFPHHHIRKSPQSILFRRVPGIQNVFDGCLCESVSSIDAVRVDCLKTWMKCKERLCAPGVPPAWGGSWVWWPSIDLNRPVQLLT